MKSLFCSFFVAVTICNSNMIKADSDNGMGIGDSTRDLDQYADFCKYTSTVLDLCTTDV